MKLISLKHLWQLLLNQSQHQHQAVPSAEPGPLHPRPVADRDHEAGGDDDDENSEEKRQQWDNPVEFLLSCISMSVGLGNVWRFPFTAYENGGGAFLIPYLLVLVLIGRPFYLLELGLGQFSSKGCVGVWDLAPSFRGVGYAQSLATFLVCSYYCVLIAIAFHFLFSSFQRVLPWSVCHEAYQANNTLCLPSGQTPANNSMNLTVVPSTEQYFTQGVLKEADKIDGLGLPDPALAGCLLLCWVLVYFTLRKGVASSGKVAYFTAIFPYVVMLTLLVKGLTLPGALEGIVFLFTPQWHRLYDPKVWYAAITQSFFSLGIGFGGLITFSSYNKYRHNIYRDATIISVTDSLTSLLAGAITFAILGHLAHMLDVPINHVVKSGGAGLAFISYPEVIASFGVVPQLFAVLFFLMLITLGMGSASGMVNTVTTVVRDAFPSLSKSVIVGVVCLFGFLAGLVYTTPQGQAVMELTDFYGGSFLILVLAVAEIVAVAWIYRTANVVGDFKQMLGRELGLYWRVCWTYLIPLVLAVILGYAIAFYKPVAYKEVALPLTAQLWGWSMTLAGVLMGLLYFLQYVVLHRGSALRPLESWGPRNKADRIDWMNNTAPANHLVEKEMMDIKLHFDPEL